MKVARFEKISVQQFHKDFVGSDSHYEDIKLPKRATTGSAGYDFYAPVRVVIQPGEMVKIPTGIRCEILDGYVLTLFPRSSLGFKYQMNLANTVGIIDSDYYHALNEGHIIAGIVNKGNKELIIEKGDRFIQGIFLPYFTADEEEVTEKRVGGFGSSNCAHSSIG